VLRSLLAVAVAIALHAGLVLSLPDERPAPPPITRSDDVIDMEFAREAAPPRKETPTAIISTPRGSTRPARKAIPSSATVSTVEVATTGKRATSGEEEEPSRRVVGFYDPWMVDELPNPRSVPALTFEPRTRVELVVTVAGSGRVEGVAASDSSSVSDALAAEIRRIRFLPARVGADAATTTVKITLLFDPSDAGARTWQRVAGGWMIRL
jgi:hypothetical protein